MSSEASFTTDAFYVPSTVYVSVQCTVPRLSWLSLLWCPPFFVLVSLFFCPSYLESDLAMSLVQHLDELSAIPFPDLTNLKCRSALTEIAGMTNDSVIDKEIKKLNAAQSDTLMKVIYVGLANDSKNSNAYFKWHSLLYQNAGVGAIVRTLNDKPIAADAPPAAAAQ